MDAASCDTVDWMLTIVLLTCSFKARGEKGDI